MQTSIFSERLKLARISKGMTQGDLSKIAGVTVAMISAYEHPDEKKVKNPSLEVVQRLSKALGASIDWLCGNKPKITGADVINFLVEYDKTQNISVDVINTFEKKDILKNYWENSGITNRNLKGVFRELNDGITAFTEKMTGDFEKYNDVFICFHNDKLSAFCNEWIKIKTLYNAGTIDENLYNLWINQQIELINKQEAKENGNNTETQ